MSLIQQPLNVYAGREAYEHIQSKSLQPNDISILLGGSSGPKWLTLCWLDRYLIGEFFKGRSKPLQMLGTSAGAWRLTSYAQQSALAAHEQLTEIYIEQRYSEKPSGQEILNTCRRMVGEMLGQNGVGEIIDNPVFRFNLITTQCHGLTQADRFPLKSTGFVVAALLNAVARKSLGWQFTRVVMHHPMESSFLQGLTDLPTRYANLTSDNLEQAILSTGSIPLIIEGVKDVSGQGTYQDGGITDYGFDLPLLPEDGFVLYPHFIKHPAPGWFDKQLSWRKPSHQNYSKTIMLVPSDEFIASLPYAKIPDRHDFAKLTDNERIRYWRSTIERTKMLADDLSGMNWQTRVKALPW